jgi:ABC-type molybdate transport system substrate-binding protein
VAKLNWDKINSERRSKKSPDRKDYLSNVRCTDKQIRYIVKLLQKSSAEDASKFIDFLKEQKHKEND